MLRNKVALAASLAALLAGGTALAGGQNQIKTPVSTVPVADEGALPNQHPWNRLAFGFGRWWGAVPLYYVPLRESVPVPCVPEVQLACWPGCGLSQGFRRQELRSIRLGATEAQIQLAGLSLNGLD